MSGNTIWLVTSDASLVVLLYQELCRQMRDIRDDYFFYNLFNVLCFAMLNEKKKKTKENNDNNNDNDNDNNDDNDNDNNNNI